MSEEMIEKVLKDFNKKKDWIRFDFFKKGENRNFMLKQDVEWIIEKALFLKEEDILKKIGKEIKYYENVESPLQNGNIKIINAFKKFKKSISEDKQ